MKNIFSKAALGSAALVLSACTSLVADVDSTSPSPKLTVNGCPVGEAWTRESVAAAVKLTPAQIVALKDIRGLSLEEICTMPPRRLARAVNRAAGKQRPDSPDKADAFREQQRAGDDGRVRTDGLLRALEQRRELLNMPKVAGVIREAWTPIGPSNIGGLVRSIVTHPTDPNALLIGSVSGGLWRTTDAGASWSFINDFLPNAVISSLARDPFNPNRIYAGTGGGIAARTFGGSRGLGVFVSNDNGATWEQMGGTMPDFALATDQSDFFLVNRVIVHATNPDIVVVATSGQFTNYGGVWRTLNATAAVPTWRKIYDRRSLDVKFNPNSPNSIIIGEGEHFYCGTDCGTDPNAGENGGGVGYIADVTTAGSSAPAAFPDAAAYTYTRNKLEAGINNRVEVAFAAATPGLAVAVIDSMGPSGGFGRMHSSNDGGVTWTFNSQPAHMGLQGFWNNSVWIDPTDSTRIVVGGVDLYRGAGVHNWWVHHTPVTWTKISSWFTDNSVHADNHAIVHATGYNGTTNRQVYIGNDGGIYRSNDIAHHNGVNFVQGWNNLSNNGLAITQFYSVAGRNDYAGGVTRIIGGTQDNGSLKAPASGTSWSSFYGGDGGFSAVDPVDPNTFYGEYVFGSMARSTTGGEASPICGGPNPITEGLADDPPFVNCGPGATSEANFIAPFVLDPNNSDTLLLGARSLWRSTNVKASQPDWHKARGFSGGATNYVSAIAIAQGNSDLVWIGYNNGSVFCTTNGTAATPTWTQVTNVPNRMILRIMIDAANHNRVFVTRGGYFGNNITEFTDPVQACKASPTATNRHGNLPQAPVRSIVRHPANPAWLYVGSEVGVFASTNGGVSWSTSNDGPAATSAEELVWLDSSTLVVATFGRGMFKTTISPGTIQLTASAVSVAETAGSVTISATRTGGNAGAVGVGYGTSPGTATPGLNFTTTSGNLAWADGDVAVKSFTVPVLDDGLVAGSKVFNVSLSSPSGGVVVGSPASIAVTVVDSGIVAALQGAIRSLITSYYNTILGRAPEAGAVDSWTGSANRVIALGGDVRELFFAMSIDFFKSQEYANRARNDAQYVTDLHRTFLMREPDPSGAAFWQGQLAQGMDRGSVLANFIFSAEFSSFMTATFGTFNPRPEVNMTIDLYRGVLNRLPDAAGFGYWLGRIRAAQCQGASAVSAEVADVASQFFASAEYANIEAARPPEQRTRQYVGDLYNAMMRRGPDLNGYQYWVGEIETGARTRDDVRAAFLGSAEFQARVSAVIAGGCFSGP